MRSILSRSAVIAGAFLLLHVGTARASSLEVQVPFPFTVNGQQLPAGHYLIESHGTEALIRGERGTGAACFVTTTPATGHDPAGNQPSLTFKRTDDRYELSGIWQTNANGQTVINH